jgi:hypothetical protein
MNFQTRTPNCVTRRSALTVFIFFICGPSKNSIFFRGEATVLPRSHMLRSRFSAVVSSFLDYLCLIHLSISFSVNFLSFHIFGCFFQLWCFSGVLNILSSMSFDRTDLYILLSFGHDTDEWPLAFYFDSGNRRIKALTSYKIFIKNV